MAFTAYLVYCSCLFLVALSFVHTNEENHFQTRSKLYPWADTHTPEKHHTKTSSKGETWQLIMSDEFDVPGRDFSPGKDYLWTALEKPDGVNGALDYLSFNMTSTTTTPDGRGIFQIKIQEEENITYTIYNPFKKPSPGYQQSTMYYRSGMVQTWNKFCFQGGLFEISLQLPAVITPESGNPGLKRNPYDRVSGADVRYYPFWPAVWFFGNLGRGNFIASTERLWPWSYNECTEVSRVNQRISACNENPGYGLNPKQGRGAPEIDLFEASGDILTTSIQITPGMPDKFQRIPADEKLGDYSACYFGNVCKTPGANIAGIPTEVYAQRGHRSWFQNFKYAAHNNCTPDPMLKQDEKTVLTNIRNGIKSNDCNDNVNTCPASRDGNSDIGYINGKSGRRWSINYDGTCMAKGTPFHGGRWIHTAKPGDPEPSYDFSTDSVSAQTPLPFKAYTDFMTYGLEWVTGPNGYLRWTFNDQPIYEIPAESLEKPPQDESNSNPHKLMIEEPMYIMMNVALAGGSSWGSPPPNAGSRCRGNGSDPAVNKICDAFPVDMKIDYIRIYQDTTSTSKMQFGCDPQSHPTKEYINANILKYTDAINRDIEVIGGAPCNTDDDCSVGEIQGQSDIRTGTCDSKKKKCVCLYPREWIGPRCTKIKQNSTQKGMQIFIAVGIVLGIAAVLLLAALLFRHIKRRRAFAAAALWNNKKKNTPSATAIETPHF